MSILDKFCIIRTRDQGVVSGFVRAVAGRAVEVTEARQLFYWSTVGNAPKLYTLFEVAIFGAGYARISQPIDEMLVLDACGVILCTPEAERDLRQSRWDKSYDPLHSAQPATIPSDSQRPTRSKTKATN